jgi:hypothetical protein
MRTLIKWSVPMMFVAAVTALLVLCAKDARSNPARTATPREAVNCIDKTQFLDSLPHSDS